MCDCGHSQDKHAGSSHEDGCTVCNCPSFEFDLGNSGVKDQFKNVPCSKGGVHDWEPVPSSGNNKDMKCAKCGMGLDQIKVADTDKQLSNAFGARARNQELAKEGAKKFGPRE